MVSNGSLATAADFPGKLRALRKRGGKLVVIDPARTQTAKLADRHPPRGPGPTRRSCSRSAVLFEEDRVDLGRLAEHVTGVEEVRTLADEFSPEAVEAACGVDAEEIRDLARELAYADRRRLRSHRHVDGRVRDDRQLARRRHQRPHPEPRPPRRRDVRARGGGAPAPRPTKPPRPAPTGGPAGSRGIRKCSPNCRPPHSPRRSTPRARARSRR